MASLECLTTIRAAVEAIVPSADGSPSALKERAEEYVVEALELTRSGLPDLAAAALNGFAQKVREGAAFSELTIEERNAVLEQMSKAEEAPVRQLAGGLLAAAFVAVYSEWSVAGGSGGEAHDRPAVWDAMGYPGPSNGYPRYREGI